MPDYQEGQTATNPKTGQKVIFKSGQWVSAGMTAPTIGKGAAGAAVPPSKIAALNALSRQLATTRSLYNKDFKGTGLGSVLEYLPSQASARYNSAAAGLSDQALSAFRVPGVGSQSDRELQSFVAANQPSSWDMDAGAEQKLSNIEGRLVAQRRAAGLPDSAPPLYRPKPNATAPAQIKGDHDYERLPSGAEFIAPDGSHRRKP